MSRALPAQPIAKVTIAVAVLQLDSEGARYLASTTELHASDGQDTSLSIGGDTGVNLLIRPHVHSAEEVTLHVEVDVHNILSSVGISRPIVKEADIRMQEGEVYILPVRDRILIALTPKIALLH
jgi:hypothetical protein